MKHTGISLSYVVPVFNEAEILDETLRVFVQELDALDGIVADFEVLVVDDASRDGSAEIARAWAERDSRVRLLRHPTNLGAGVGILTALAHATKEWFSVNCADRPFDTRDIRSVAPLLAESDVVVVARTDRSANSPYRKATSWVNYQLVKLLFRIPVEDCQFVQFYRTRHVKDLRILSRGTLVPPELIMRAVRNGARLRQLRLPFHRRPGGTPKYGHPRHALRTLLEMARLRRQLWREEAARDRLSPDGGTRSV